MAYMLIRRMAGSFRAAADVGVLQQQIGKGRDRGGALHDRPADAADGAVGRDPRQSNKDDDRQSRRPPCPRDKVNRQFRVPRPNALWVADFTYVRPGRGLSTLPSSSMPSPAASSAGGFRDRPRPALSSMPWNRRSTTGAPSFTAWCTIAIAAVCLDPLY